MNPENRHIVITGAASGIGRALLAQLSAIPCTILAADINAETLRTAAEELSGQARIFTFVGDLTTEADTERLFQEAEQQLGHIDVFIANAGFAYYEQHTTPDWGHIERIFALNVFSPIYSAARMARHAAGRPYTLVMVASAMAYIAIPGYSLYAATKAALDRFAEAYRHDMPAQGHLMVVYPVATRTGFFAGAGQNVPVMPPSQAPEVVAKAIIAGLRAKKRKVFPSTTFRLLRLTGITLQLTRMSSHIIGGMQLRQWLKQKPPDAG
jgi:short-subunit dehydrogenase